MGTIRNILAFLFSIFSLVLVAQEYPYAYLVEFTDKTNTKYSLDNPEEFLSARAIERRQKFNIAITEQDFPVNNWYLDSLTHNGAKLHTTSRWFNSAVFYTNNPLFENDALKYPFVKAVSLVYGKNMHKSGNLKNKWQSIVTHDDYGASYNQIMMCNAQKLHARGYRGAGIQIAVLDGGFYRADQFSCFDSLFFNNRIIDHWDFVSHNDNVFDDDSHGMSVLSIMGGNLPGELMGTAPESSYYLFRTEDVSTEYLIEEENWIAGAERADSAGADIITASLGYSLYDNETMNHTYAAMDGKSTRVTQGAEIAFSKGIFIVNSAGNEGASDWKHITAPSDGEHVLCIGAVDSEENIASFSSLGPSFDGRVKPDIAAQGVATTLLRSSGNVGAGNGTSFSCPLIAGMVACLWQALPNYSNQQLLALIRSLGEKYNAPDNYFGYGIPDFGKAIFQIDSINYQAKGRDEIIKIYPNPFANEIRLQLFNSQEQTIKIAIYDFRGVLVYTESTNYLSDSYNNVVIKGLSKLESGFYFLTVTTQHGIFSKTIVRF